MSFEKVFVPKFIFVNWCYNFMTLAINCLFCGCLGTSWSCSFDLKTTEKNGVIIEETINGEQGMLEVCKVFLF